MRASGLAGVALFLLACGSAAAAQPSQPDFQAQRAAMDRLAGLEGDWFGVADITYPTAARVYQHEHVDRELDGLVLVIHDQGFTSAARTGAPLFSAMGLISYDDARGVYEYRLYNGGRATNSEMRLSDDGRLEWLTKLPTALLRNTLTFSPSQWTEVVEGSRDGGATWGTITELRMTKPQ